MIYKKNINAKLVKVDDIFYIVDRYDVYKINEVAARIFELCNGINTNDKIAYLLSKHYALNNVEQILSDIDNYLKELIELNLVKEIK